MDEEDQNSDSLTGITGVKVIYQITSDMKVVVEFDDANDVVKALKLIIKEFEDNTPDGQ